MNMHMLGCIGFYFVTKRRLFISIVERIDVERVPEEIKEFLGNKNIITNIFRVQANNSVMCGYFCIGSCNEIERTNLTDQTKFR